MRGIRLFVLEILFFSAFLSFAQAATASTSQTLPPPQTLAQLEVLIASPSALSLESLFGHLSLRLKYRATSGRDVDLALSFIAKTGDDGEAKRVFKGLIGSYRSALLIEPFAVYVRRTALDENRSISRYVLPADRERSLGVHRSLDTLLQGRARLGRYFFFWENCATLLDRFLVQGGYTLHRPSKWLLPIPPASYVRAVFTANALAFLELPPIRSAGSQLKSIGEHVGWEAHADGSTDLSPLLKNLAALTVGELNFLLLFETTETPGARRLILRELRSRQDGKRFSDLEILGFLDSAPLLSVLCHDSDCVQNQTMELARLYPADKLKQLEILIEQELRRIGQLVHGDSLRSTPQYLYADQLRSALGKAGRKATTTRLQISPHQMDSIKQME